MLFFQALLSSKSDSVSQLESDVLRLEVLAQETSDQLSAREEQLRELAEKASEVSATANLVAGKETERDTLAAKKNLYYMVTRIVWEKVKRDDSKVNGFVLNPSKNEVSTFTVDRNEQGPIFLGCNLAENSLPILKQVGRQNVLYAVKSMKVTVFSVFHHKILEISSTRPQIFHDDLSLWYGRENARQKTSKFGVFNQSELIIASFIAVFFQVFTCWCLQKNYARKVFLC